MEHYTALKEGLQNHIVPRSVLLHYAAPPPSSRPARTANTPWLTAPHMQLCECVASAGRVMCNVTSFQCITWQQCPHSSLHTDKPCIYDGRCGKLDKINSVSITFSHFNFITSAYFRTRTLVWNCSRTVHRVSATVSCDVSARHCACSSFQSQFKSAICRERLMLVEVRKNSTLFSPMQTDPLNIRERLFQGIDKDYNVSL